MKKKEITVLKVSPLEAPCVCTLVNELKELQKAVSIEAEQTGLIEIIEIGNELGMTKMGAKMLIDRTITKLKQFARQEQIK